MLFLSGIQTIPGVLIVPRLHPQYVNQKELSVWLENFHKNPLSLQSLCRIRVRRCLGNTLLLKVKSLPIPSYLKDYVALKHLSQKLLFHEFNELHFYSLRNISATSITGTCSVYVNILCIFFLLLHCIQRKFFYFLTILSSRCQ